MRLSNLQLLVAAAGFLLPLSGRTYAQPPADFDMAAYLRELSAKGKELGYKEAVYKQTPQGELRIYFGMPAGWSPKNKRPVLIFFFGGGWTGGNLFSNTWVAEHFLKRGCVVGLADYRVRKRQGVRLDKCAEDARSAVRWVRANSGNLGVDPERVIAGGGSAGGHIAACTAIPGAPNSDTDDLRVSCKPNGLVLFYPVASLVDDSRAGAFKQVLGEELALKLSPARHVSKSWPPTVLFSGTADIELPNGVLFHNQAKAAGVPFELYLEEGGGHGVVRTGPRNLSWLQYASDFLIRAGIMDKGPQPDVPPGQLRKYDGEPVDPTKIRIKRRGAPPAAKPSPADKVEIRITSDKPVPINPKIYGINCAEMFIFDLVQKTEYLSALDELHLNTFLFPGGSSYHHPTGSGGFNIRTEELAQSRHGTNHRINKGGSPDFFQQYIGFMKPMGGHAVFIPNIANGTVEELDYYLKNMREARIPVDSVVLGMEVQLGAFRFKDSAAYIRAITPYIDFLKSKYPGVRIVGWSTPAGRRSAVPGSFRQWNKDVAKIPGIDGFAQYGWTEFGGAALRSRDGAEESTPEQRLKEYDAFVADFPTRQIKVYAEDWGSDKKMFMLQWGTHRDRNTVVEGLHMANFYFFMTEYNAQHDNYFEAATWSAPLMNDIASGQRKNSDGMLYKKDIALWTPYLYARPLRYFYSGDKNLLKTSVAGVKNNGPMEVVKVLAAAGPEGKKYLCVLNRGPAVALGGITIDGKAIPAGATVRVESVSGDTLSATGGTLKTFSGDKTLGSVRIERYSVTTLIIPVSESAGAL